MSYKARAQDRGDDIATDVYKCSECGTQVTGKTLADFGARCIGCFKDYQRSAQKPNAKPDNSLMSPAGKCLVNIACSEKGEARLLTDAQKHMVKSCLRVLGDADRNRIKAMNKSWILEEAA